MAIPPSTLYHGTAYYPELWPESAIATDLAAMQALGINLVRIGEFAWSRLEPDKGHIDTSFFAHVLDQLHAAGLHAVLCTPTATPPVWLTHGHPERCFTSSDGVPMSHGSRQHACYEHPDVRQACARITEALSRDLGRHPAVIAWQIDNELKCHVAEDFNPATISRWHAWLEQRYGTIERLNDAWGTQIWSQRYQAFPQVPPPSPTPFLHNPSLLTAYRLFNRESVAEFVAEQCALVRRHSSAPITHNLQVGFSVNVFKTCAPLDFVSWDDYPAASQWRRIVLHCDLFRPVKPDRPFWLMETSCAHNGWLTHHETSHPPGFLAAEAVATYALGGAAFNYWLWRQQRSGCELAHSALLQSWGTLSIGYTEAAAVQRARIALQPLFTSSIPEPAEIAVTWSDHSRAMLQTEPLGARSGDAPEYVAIVSDWHRRLLDLGYHREIRLAEAALEGLRVLITPAMLAVDDDFLLRARSWVEAGGIWIVAPLTGVRTSEHTAHTTYGLGALELVAGVETVFAFPATQTSAQGSALGDSAELTGWCLALRPRDPDTGIVGVIHGGAADGLAFITEKKLGQGLIVVIGAQPAGVAGNRLLDRLTHRYAQRAGLSPSPGSCPQRLVAPRRTNDGRLIHIIVDFSGEASDLPILPGTTDALTHVPVLPPSLRLPAYGWAALAPPGNVT